MKKIARSAFFLLLIGGVIGYFYGYRPVFGPNVDLGNGVKEREFFIPTGMTYDEVGKKLLDEKIIVNVKSFHRVAKYMNYPNHVYAGRYIIDDGMNNRELVGLLRSGKQAPIDFTFVKFRTPEELAAHATERLEMTEEQLLKVLNNTSFLKRLAGLTPENVLAIFIPNTYQIYWNITPEEFLKRMYSEYRTFWNDQRNELREAKKLDRLEVMTLASIVEEETNKADERPSVAGLYLNRIRKRWKLEADPTVKYAVGDFGLRRILNTHLEVDSPYNTYKYQGIPPGPICTPSIPSIEAVLNEEKHDFMYMCARADGSGYHHFSETLEEHLAYAKDYHRMLNREGIK